MSPAEVLHGLPWALGFGSTLGLVLLVVGAWGGSRA